MHIRCKYHTHVYIRFRLATFLFLSSFICAIDLFRTNFMSYTQIPSTQCIEIVDADRFGRFVSGACTTHSKKNPLNLSACHESAHYMHFDRQNNHKTPKVFLSFFKNGMYPITFLSILGALANNTFSMIVLSGIRSMCAHRNGTLQIAFLFGFDFIVYVF